MIPRPPSLPVSRNRFIMAWCCIQLFHLLCISNAVGIIEVHRYFIVRNLGVTIDYLGRTTFSFFKPVIAVNIVVIGCHSIAFSLSLWWSIKYGEWRFTDKGREKNKPRLQPQATLIRGITLAKSVTTLPQSPLNRRTTILTRAVFFVKTHASSVNNKIKMIGVEGSYFDLVFFALEVVEIVLQTYQAHKLSTLVPRVWINRLYAISLVLNCWSTAFVHRYIRSDQLARRIVLVVVDSLFDAITSMAIPLAVFYPYYLQFDADYGDFQLLNYYNDVWFIQAVSENRQIFVNSWIDFISKFTPSFTVLGGIVVVKSYLVMDRRDYKGQRVSTVHTHGSNRPSRSCNAVTPTTHTCRMPSNEDRAREGPVLGTRTEENCESDHRSRGDQASATHAIVFRKHTHSLHDMLLALYGLAILAVHIHATVVAIMSNTKGCLLEVRPWLQTVYNCVAFEFNCAHGDFGDGSQIGFEDLANVINIRGLKSVIFASCAHFHVPPILQELQALEMVKIYNSTVEIWDSKAELRDELHQDLQLLYVCDSNFSGGELPRGLLGDQFPSRLADIEFSGTNLASLPTNLHEKWLHVGFFVLERSPSITELPPALAKMKISQLMLSSNRITSIPGNILANQAFWMLKLGGNPLQSLPTTIGSLANLQVVGFAYSNVSALPQWITDSSSADKTTRSHNGVTLEASGTSLCAETGTSLREMAISWFEWDCSSNEDPDVYPVEAERVWRDMSLAARERK